MSAERVRIGVVGAGYWGPNLIRNSVELGILDSVCDSDAQARGIIQRQFPNTVTLERYPELLQRQIDGVIIATPAQLHASMALAALEAGKHVFIEKPLALTLQEGKQVMQKASSTGLQVFVGHLLLYHPAVRKLRALIAAGEIGDVWHVRSRRLGLGKLRAHESVWWSFAPHDLAVILAILGDEPTKATAAQTSRRVKDTCDMAYADFQFPGGRSAHVEVCWLDPQKSARLDVFGSSGVLSMEDSRQGSTLKLLPSGAEPGASLQTWRGQAQSINVEQCEPLKAELEAFVRSIETGEPAETDAREGLSVMRALELADQNAIHTDLAAAVSV